MSVFSTFRREWLSNPRADILAGIVVALALIPEAIGFSIIAGVDPRVGLYASFSIAVIISFVGGRPGMISAATAAVAVVVVPLVKEYGVDYLFAATILMGIFQVIAGFLRLDLLMQYVSKSVVTGFVNALAILIFMAQLPQLIDVTWVTYAMVAGGLAIIYLFPLLTKLVPSPLVAIIALTALAIYGGLNVNTVGDMGKLPSSLPAFLIPNVPFNLETLRIIFPYSLTMAAVGLLESMLTAQIVDDMTDTPSNKRRECKGQGIANFMTGLLGGMGGCAMIWQSVINAKWSGSTRLSTFVAGSVLLSLIVVWTQDRAQGVLAGVLLSGVFFAGKVRRMFAVSSQLSPDGQTRTYYYAGQVFFASTERFAEAIDFNEKVDHVVLDVSAAHFWDISAVGALDKVVSKLRRVGVSVGVAGLNEASATLVGQFSMHDKPEANASRKSLHG